MNDVFTALSIIGAIALAVKGVDILEREVFERTAYQRDNWRIGYAIIILALGIVVMTANR